MRVSIVTSRAIIRAGAAKILAELRANAASYPHDKG